MPVFEWRKLAGNVVFHGFSQDSRKHSVDIRGAHRENKVILRIRDNCSAYDLPEYVRLMEAGEMGKNVGITVTCRVATVICYQNLLGKNVLTIQI